MKNENEMLHCLIGPLGPRALKPPKHHQKLEKNKTKTHPKNQKQKPKTRPQTKNQKLKPKTRPQTKN